MNENEKSQTLEEEETVPPESGDEEAVTEAAEEAGTRLSWEEILADPEYRRSYDESVQRIVQKRLRARAGAEARLERLGPILEALGARYGADLADEALDMQALSEKISGAAERRAALETAERHLDALLEQAQALRESVPGFDLLRELEDPAFLRMTAPHSRIALADAYYARHRAECERETARRSLEAVSRSVRSLGARPRELRDEGDGAGLANDPRQMSRQEREALKQRILAAKAQGKKLHVGE